MQSRQSKITDNKPGYSPAATSAAALQLQRKLRIGSETDPLEAEADSVADRVMAMSEVPLVQRKCASCEEEDKRLQRKLLASSLTPFVQRKSSEVNSPLSDTISARIESRLGRGAPLPEPTRSFMENRFGADFADVRIHADHETAQLSNNLNAQAFTVGRDIYFDHGKFSPQTHDGLHLIAHELTHTIQQSGSGEAHYVKGDEQRTLSPVARKVDSPVNNIRQLPDKQIQREVTSDHGATQRDDSLGFVESMAIDTFASTATAGIPFLKPIVKGGFTGFYTEIRYQVETGKGQQFMERVEELFLSPSEMLACGKGYYWGLLQGLWSPVQGIVDIVKFAWKLQAWQMQALANVIENYHAFAEMLGTLISRFSALGDKAQAVMAEIRKNPMAFAGRLIDALSGSVFELAKRGGHQAGQAFFRFLEQPWGQIGEGIGIVVGSVLVEVLMAVFTEGIGNALAKVGQVLDKVAPTLMKGVRFITSELGAIITEINRMVATLKAGFAQAGRTLLKGFEDFISEATSVFDDLIALLKKLFSGAEDAVAKMPADLPLPVKNPSPHSTIPARPTHVETVPVHNAHADPLPPKEPIVDAEAPTSRKFEPTSSQEPLVSPPQADAAVQYVEDNPSVIKGEAGHRRAAVGEEHEIVEVPDQTIPSGIHCEIHSSPPYAEVPCPKGMGKESVQPSYDDLDLPTLRQLASTDKEAAFAHWERYKKMSDLELFQRFEDNADEVAAAVIRERYPSNEKALLRILGSDYRPPHSATVSLRRGRNEVTRTSLVSGNMTPEERVLGFPKSMLATHTEARAVRQLDLHSGDILEITGQYNPCSSCMRAMQEAATRTGAKINYWWPGCGVPMRFKP